MHIHADKTPEDKSTAAAGHLQQQKKNDASVFLEDNRPHAVSQRKFQEKQRQTQEIPGVTDYPSSAPVQRMFKQPLITNYTGATVGHTLEDNPPRAFVTSQLQIEERGEGFVATLPGVQGPDMGGFGHLDLYEDNNGDWWINHIEVSPQTQRMGVARRLVQAAIHQHGHIYASNSPHDPGGPDDTRHLSAEGAALVTGLIADGTMHADWLRAPVV